MWFTSGEEVSFPVDFLVDGEFVVPTAAWTTVRDGLGEVVEGLQDVALSTANTSTFVTIPASVNTLDPGQVHSTRYVVVTFIYEGRQHRRELSYRLRPFVTMTATEDDVRRELGLDRSELPDADIDLYWAYLTLAADYRISEAMIAGDRTTLAANQAIAVQAALDVVGSLRFRAAVKMRAEDSAFERMPEFSIDQIRIELGERLAALIDVVEGVENVGLPILVVATPTDPITGA